MKTIRGTILLIVGCMILACSSTENDPKTQVYAILQDSVLSMAHTWVDEVPKTVTSYSCARSSGGLHDFYSEGDYWWPDSTDLEGPYVRRDGLTNPNNFTAHREALLRFSEIVGTLTSAYLISKDPLYAEAVLNHCNAWFLDERTRMNPHLLYAQAIKGRHSGRGIGIIDGIHFMEVVQSLIVLEHYGLIDGESMAGYRKWFSEFLTWLTTHPYGKDEMVHPNNHGTCWNMQVGLYAVFTKNDRILSLCRENYKNNLLPNQMADDGSFPLELERTKPYGYSLFNLDAMVMNCWILSDTSHDLWAYTTDTNKSIALGLEFMAPFIEHKNKWPLAPDVMYWEQWPVAHPSMLFGAIALHKPDYFDLWKKESHFYDIFEVKRNVPIRNPLIWLATADL
ncbi:alginate lyase family protein [Pareuzebyella sediminis]|uniref:alginate lyase family protein n=1 Tax=Pareuzebyella sediminis TaxID=2607998 RepID=UPI0011F07D76|nr:alginate lyase family protein [Pareuzebyella sediminis]